MTDTANPNPDWYPDPTGRFEQRYWDGSQWTEHVSSAGQQRTDALPGAAPADTTEFGGVGPTGADAVAPEPTAPVEPEPAFAVTPEPDPEPAPAFAVSPEPEPVAASDPPAEWYPDPTGRYEQRYWDGGRWTEHVTAAGQQGVDPLPDESGPLAEQSAVEPEPAQSAPEPEPEPAQSAPEPEPEPESPPDPAPAAVNPFAAAGATATDTGPTSSGGPLGPVPGIDPPSSTGPAEPATAGTFPPSIETDDAGTDPDPFASVGSAAAAQAAPAMAGPPADWYPDPTGHQELRYWDGSQWTEHASTAGQQVVDPIT